MAALCHENPADYDHNPLDVFDAIAHGRRRDHLEQALRKALEDHDLEPSQAHYELSRLPWAITTNYDGLLHRLPPFKIRACDEQDDAWFSRPDLEIPRLMHGTLDRPHTLTREDYRLWPEKHPRTARRLEHLLLNKTVRFAAARSHAPPPSAAHASPRPPRCGCPPWRWLPRGASRQGLRDCHGD